MTQKELRDVAIKRQQDIVEKAKIELRNLTDEEQIEFNRLQREIESYSTDTEVEDETRRCAEIYSLCRDFNIDPTEYIKGKNSIDSVRESVLNMLKESNQPVATKARGDVTVKRDEEDKFRAAAADGIILRSGDISIDKVSEGAREFRNMSLKDLAIFTLSRNGESMDSLARMSADEVYQKLTTERAYFSPESAFPAILDIAINKSYTEMYTHAPATFDQFVKIGSLSDFKKHDNYYVAGPAGEFKEVPENGELEHDIPKDIRRPQRQLRTYGRQFSMSRKAFIDDDIGFITTMPGRYARSAKTTINNQVYKILFNNSTIYDGIALFDQVQHKNVLATGSIPSADVINKMILALTMQQDEFGNAIILNPGAIITPVGYAMDLYKIFQSASIQTAGNTQAANPLYRLRDKLKIVEDPTLNALAKTGAAPWFMIASPDDLPVIQIDFLNGQQIPNIRRMETAGLLGYTWDIYLDWGINVMNYRGIVKNPGTVIADPLA